MRPKRSDSLTARSSRCFTPNSGSFRTVCTLFAQMSYLFWIYFRALAALRLPARLIGVPATYQLQSMVQTT